MVIHYEEGKANTVYEGRMVERQGMIKELWLDGVDEMLRNGRGENFKEQN